MRSRCPKCRSVNIIALDDDNKAIACGRCSTEIPVPKDYKSPGIVYGDFCVKGTLVTRTHETDLVAEQISLGRDIVLKVIPAELSANKKYMKAFLKACRTAATLVHPMLAPVHTIGKEEGIYFLARALGEGSTLQTRVTQDGPLDWREASQVVIDICEALDYAWDKANIMHMNLKPDYILTSKANRAQLADVGLAGLDPDFDSDKIIGTPQYIAPERIVGLDGDNRSDLYSLGVTFYYALTGEFPFNGDNTNDIISKHLQELPPPANQINPSVPEGICIILNMMLEKNPNLRYQSGKMLIHDLNCVLSGQTPAHAVKAGSMAAQVVGASVEEDGVLKPGTLKVRIEGSDEATIIEGQAKVAQPVELEPEVLQKSSFRALGPDGGNGFDEIEIDTDENEAPTVAFELPEESDLSTDEFSRMAAKLNEKRGLEEPPEGVPGKKKRSSKGRTTIIGMKKKKKLKSTRAGMGTKFNIKKTR